MAPLPWRARRTTTWLLARVCPPLPAAALRAGSPSRPRSTRHDCAPPGSGLQPRRPRSPRRDAHPARAPVPPRAKAADRGCRRCRGRRRKSRHRVRARQSRRHSGSGRFRRRSAWRGRNDRRRRSGLTISACAPTRLSAATASARRQSSGSGMAINPARNTPSSVSTLSTVLAIWMPTSTSLRSPIRRSRPAMAETMRSACA